MQKVHCFVDEYGDTSISIEKDGVSAFFIITIIFITEGDLATKEKAAELIRSQYFQAGEVKSSKIGGNDERRIKLLNSLNEIGFRTFSLAIDKRELYKNSGLAWKRSFFKYLHRLLYERVYRIFENLDVTADEHGSEEFMEGFKAYLDRVIPPNLFSTQTFRFAKSTDVVLLQVADIISGSMARCLDPDKLSPRHQEILQLLTKCSIGIDVWPPQSIPEPEASLEVSQPNYLNLHIRRHCIRQARIFLGKMRADSAADENVRLQVETLSYLLFHAQFVSDKAFVPTKKILDHLKANAQLDVTQHQLRSNVISKLRDASVIIANGPRGYKIPVNDSDIESFVSHANSIILPMLARLNRAREELKMASLGEVDILSNPEFANLREMASVISKEVA